MTDLLLAPVILTAALWLFVTALSRPRLVTYGIFALAPTQFIFIPVSSFFLSPIDVIVLAAGCAFAVRAIAGGRRASMSLWAHRYLVLMVAAYLVGFAVLGVYSRTIVRVLMAIVPSLLACEVLRERRHFLRAATALILAGVVDAGYGMAFYAIGQPLHPTRFSGMSGVNFSATVILTAAAIAFAQVGRARNWLTLSKPGALITIGLATFSQAGVLAFGTTWLVVLRRVMRRRNVVRVTAAAVVTLIVALSFASVRDKIASRNVKQLEIDGVARNSADVRLMVLRAAWAGFSDSPFVGIGYSRFSDYSTRDPEISASTAGHGYGTHNTYVEILVEGGLLAFVCFMLHFSCYIQGLRWILSDLAKRKDAAFAGTLVGLPIVLVSAAFANMLLHYHFWAVSGLALAYVRIRRHDARLLVVTTGPFVSLTTLAR